MNQQHSQYYLSLRSCNEKRATSSKNVIHEMLVTRDKDGLFKHSVKFSVNEKFLQYAKFDQPYFVEITSYFAKMKLKLIFVYFQANISAGWFNRLFFKSF